MKNFLAIADLGKDELEKLVRDALAHKLSLQGGRRRDDLSGQVWGMLFTKSSTRTRVSFEVGVRQLGGSVLFLSPNDLQLGRGEPICDTARVFGRMLDGLIIRTFAQQDLIDFAKWSGLPTINALTDAEHPCQIIADLLTILEKTGDFLDKKVVFLGDGACNVALSWAWAAQILGFELVIAAPDGYQPSADFLEKLSAPNVKIDSDVARACADADVLYTDVWVSMGQEQEGARRLQDLRGFDISAQNLALAKPNALVMHCLPAYRGKEISAEILEAHAETIFTQAENRLHAQKAILCNLVEN